MIDIKRTWTYLSDSKKRPILLRTFRIWQRRPHQVRPITADIHQCCSCGTSYQGNYCPRCGQSASIGRFSFKNAFLLFLDVWGIGNRSMFRTIRDLILRPGHMIHDYLHGMQSAYFPPFKMFFLLTALSFVVEHGIHLTATPSAPSAPVKFSANTSDVNEIIIQKAAEASDFLYRLSEANPAIFALTMLAFFSIPLYLLFRRSPRLADLRYAEFAVALVYTANAYTIFSIVGDITHESLIQFFAFVMFVITLKQFSGCTAARTTAKVLAAAVITCIVFIALSAIALIIASVIYT